MKLTPIKTALSEKDFIQISFLLLYQKPAILILNALAVGFFVFSGVLYFLNITNNGSGLITATAMLLAFPGITYFNAKKTYTLNPRLNETVWYSFEDRFLKMKGASFNSELSWDKIHKVTRSKNWLLIWQTKDFANAIKMNEVDEEHLTQLKNILNTNKVKYIL